MPPQINIVFVLMVACPLAWLASEFQQQRWLRITLGMLSLALAVFLAGAWSLVERFNYNAWYGAATAELMDLTIQEIEAGRTEKLLIGLRELRTEFQPTYENRAHYDQLVEEFVKQTRADENRLP